MGSSLKSARATTRDQNCGKSRMSPRKPISDAIGKTGVNYVRTIVERANSLFHPIHQENDQGIDAIIELVEGTDVRGACIAIQIRSGESYKTSTGYAIRANQQHLRYWARHSLQVVGIVYDPDKDCAYWTDISFHLKREPELILHGPYTLPFEPNGVNTFDDDGFATFFRPIFLRKLVRLPLSRAIGFAKSTNPTQHHIGLHALLYEHAAELATWDTFEQLLRERSTDSISPLLPYALAHIPGHMDIAWGNINLPEEIRRTVKARLSSAINYEIVFKLLCLVDENGFDRAAIGQSVESIIMLCPNNDQYLARALQDEAAPPIARRAALYLLACYRDQKDAEDMLMRHLPDDEIGTLAKEILESIRLYGHLAR